MSKPEIRVLITLAVAGTKGTIDIKRVAVFDPGTTNAAIIEAATNLAHELQVQTGVAMIYFAHEHIGQDDFNVLNEYVVHMLT